MTTFVVGEAFPANPANTALMQLWIATRHILVLQRALLAKPGPDAVEHEQFLHTFLAIAATLKEAADAFCVADRLGVFDRLPPDIQPQLVIARQECNESNADSVQKRVLVRLRNNAGAHFDKKQIQRGLALLSSKYFPLKIGGGSFFESSFPLAVALVENILEAHSITPQNALHEFPAVINLGSALQKLADAMVTAAANTPVDQRREQ